MKPDLQKVKLITESATEREEDLAQDGAHVCGLIRVHLDVVDRIASVAYHDRHSIPIDEPVGLS